MSDLPDLLKNIKIIENDGSERTMTDEEAQDLAATLDHISERIEEERPRMELIISQLNEAIPDLEINSIGGNCPVQGNGTYQGEEFYFRSRGRYASLSVGSTDGKSPNSWNPKRYAELLVTPPGDEFGAGWLTPEQVAVVLPLLIDNLEEQSAEENQARIDEFSAAVNRLVKEMKKDSHES